MPSDQHGQYPVVDPWQLEGGLVHLTQEGGARTAAAAVVPIRLGGRVPERQDDPASTNGSRHQRLECRPRTPSAAPRCRILSRCVYLQPGRSLAGSSVVPSLRGAWNARPGREYNSRRMLGGRRQAVRRAACALRVRALSGDVPRYACSVATSTSRARAFARCMCLGVRQRTRMSAGLATTTARH